MAGAGCVGAAGLASFTAGFFGVVGLAFLLLLSSFLISFTFSIFSLSSAAFGGGALACGFGLTAK